MPEEGKNMEREDQGQKGGEIDSRWTGVPESDPDQSWGRTRDALRSGELKKSSKKLEPRPEKAPSKPVPWNKDMLRADAQGRYRIVNPDGTVSPLPKPAKSR